MYKKKTLYSTKIKINNQKSTKEYSINASKVSVNLTFKRRQIVKGKTKEGKEFHRWPV